MFYVCDGRRHLLRWASMAAPKDGGQAAAGAAGGGRRPRPEKDGGGGAAPPARPQWRSFLGQGGPAARAGRGGARSGQRMARPLVVFGPRPAGSPRGRGPRGSGRGEGVGEAHGPRARARTGLPPPSFPRLPLGGAAHPQAAPTPFRGPSTAPPRRLRKGAGAPGPLLPRTAQAGPARGRALLRGAGLRGASGRRVRARRPQACHRAAAGPRLGPRVFARSC